MVNGQWNFIEKKVLRVTLEPGNKRISSDLSWKWIKDKCYCKSCNKKILMNIIHLNADGFFAACEGKNPSLRGKKVIVGQGVGIVLALTYEAKDVGIRRGMLIHEAKKLVTWCCDISIKFYSYGLYSKRISKL